jgi:hypothetical protein
MSKFWFKISHSFEKLRNWAVTKPEATGLRIESMRSVLLWISIIYANWIHRPLIIYIPLETSYERYLFFQPARPFVLLMFCVALFLMYRKRISIALPFLIVPMSFFIADIIHFAAMRPYRDF